ncbi:uncharacterized protein STEHIDRAFT_108317 [Stereum hirsutum FP-91666 SS1]|uniref:uncharacterized protein n=1 Tax=Stereum hirsutum (strain FP-91666) TaxID=721885 RepID=UPI000440EDC5|nr:uncharacterized protein STEHIDRAFT_108317 [Stereum hirsutum FP-91666 SS1]EIM89619.1 hypothetical protein STEHIDRAFT_108317 [Stereum hirsutum FP-91666 SS1]
MPESPPFDSTAEESFLELGADTNKSNWTWSKKSKWEAEEGEYQQFYDHWRDRIFPTSQTFPYVLHLGVDDDGEPLLPFHGKDTTGNRILVTKSYDDMFHRILRFRATGERHHGVVITGQPGSGKTTFQKYMLARLLSTKQVVLFSSSSLLYLFFDGRVYLSKTGHFLPQPSQTSREIRPVDVSPPDPSRYKDWRKQANAALWGMPLWSMEELLAGLPVQPGYDRLRTDLERILPFLDEDTSFFNRTAHSLPKMTDAVIEVLKRERRRRTEGDSREEEAGSNIKDDKALLSTASKDEVDDALKILVRNATEEFGFAPHDVYQAVFELPLTQTEHDAALVGFGCSEILASVRAFAINRTFPSDTSYRIFAMLPLQNQLSSSTSEVYDDWAIDFKSIQIAKKVVFALIDSEETHEDLQKTYDLLYRYPRGSTLAGCVFEAMVHRMLYSTSFEERELWQIRMDRTETPGVYSTNFTTSNAWRSPPPHDGASDSMILVDLNGIETTVQVDRNRGRNYYIPTPSCASPDPFFHSFSVDFDGPQHIGVVISVFGISMSGRHCTSSESSEGYHFIRKIVARVRALLASESERHRWGAELEVQVRVAYCLVCPEGQRVYEYPAWEMPMGWDELDTADSGEEFCVELKLQGRV